MTLAMIEAAAMEMDFLSPPMMAISLNRLPGIALPSMSTLSGGIDNWSSARRMARWVALRMLCSSISLGVASPTPMTKATDWIWSKSFSLFCSESFLESFNPSI